MKVSAIKKVIAKKRLTNVYEMYSKPCAEERQSIAHAQHLRNTHAHTDIYSQVWKLITV